MIMAFNWLKNHKKQPPTNSRSPIKISSSSVNEAPKSVNSKAREVENHQSVTLKQANGSEVPGKEFGQSGKGHLCGFATGPLHEINQSNNNTLATEVSNTLLARLQNDELFRVRVLTANSIEEQMEILETNNIKYSGDELQKTLDSYIKEKAIDCFANRSLWGNKIS